MTQRLIKFRQPLFSREGVFQQFHYWGAGIEGDGGPYWHGPLEVPTTVKMSQQYTGLKDKNGVEIYEGDIVKKAGESPEDDAIGPIEYSENAAMFVRRIDKDCRIGLCITDRRDIEVIGHIHEALASTTAEQTP